MFAAGRLIPVGWLVGWHSQGHTRATPGPCQGHACPPAFGKVGKKIFIF